MTGEEGLLVKLKNMNWKRIIFILSYLYLTLPFIVFICGYLKIRIATVLLIITFVSLYLTIKDIPIIEEISINKNNIVKIIFIIAVIGIWVYYSGVGNLVWQNKDHFWRNGIYEALVKEGWPVGQAYITTEGESIRMLVYYIGFWLPSVIIGKLFGIEAGYYFQFFWAILGIFLVYMLICIWREKISIWPLILFVFFSGLDIIYLPILGNKVSVFSNQFLDTPIKNYSYTSMTVDLFHVYNQAIPGWVATMLLLEQRNHKSIIFILATVMLNATFPFIGLIPIVIYFAFSKYIEKEKYSSDNQVIKVQKFLKSFCTFQNLIGAGCIGIISFLYLKLNVSGEMIKPIMDVGGDRRPRAVISIVTNVYNFHKDIFQNQIFIYVIFILFEVGIYLILTYRQQRRNGLFYVIVISLLLIPFVQVGYGTDFCMRVSIPAIFILYIFIVDLIDKNENKHLKYLTLIVLLIGSINGLHEFARTLGFGNSKDNAVIRIEELCQGGNFSGEPDNFFFQILCKPMPMKVLNNMLIEYCTPEADEFLVTGAEFSKEQNSLVAKQLVVDFNRKVSGDIVFEDGGMLDDNSVSYQLILNGYNLGELNIDNRQILINEKYFNEYAQQLTVKINREVKLYSSDNFKLYSID